MTTKSLKSKFSDESPRLSPAGWILVGDQFRQIGWTPPPCAAVPWLGAWDQPHRHDGWTSDGRHPQAPDVLIHGRSFWDDREYPMCGGKPPIHLILTNWEMVVDYLCYKQMAVNQILRSTKDLHLVFEVERRQKHLETMIKLAERQVTR